MSTEQGGRHTGDHNWLGDFMIEAIDRAVQREQLGKIMTSERYRIKLVDMILAPLIIKRVPFETLEHLDIKFVAPEAPDATTINTDPAISRINEILDSFLGHEVTIRLRLSLNNDRVRTFPH
ncbi:MAG: hypothetical protein NT162_00985 [Candidatus Woesebacteria bacterium]|nr:hypothetical protein [Candidatus Woesebacteria bacterium]